MKRFLALLLVLSMVFALCGCASSDYKQALRLYEEEKYKEAQAAFEALGDYKDSKVKVCESLISQISLYDFSDIGFYKYGDADRKAAISKAVAAAEKAYRYYESLTESEKEQVSNYQTLPSEDVIAETREALNKAIAEDKIKKEVLDASVKKVKEYLKNPSSYQERTDKTSSVTVLWDEEDPTRVSGLVYIYYNALNNFGGRIDDEISGIWEGTYINGVFTLTENSIATELLIRRFS